MGRDLSWYTTQPDVDDVQAHRAALNMAEAADEADAIEDLPVVLKALGIWEYLISP